MQTLNSAILGRTRALAIVIACAGPLAGCVPETLKGASSGGGSSSSTSNRSLSFVDAPSLTLGTIAWG